MTGATGSRPGSPLISVTGAQLDDLRRRLAATRWPADWPLPGWQAGTDTGVLRRLAGYWASGYDWRAHEAAINALPSHFADLDGVALHYLRYDGGRAGALPIVLTNGWPSTLLAEQQGWDAVTTRQLSERIEYSQPVLYSHFRGKREIIGAVALEGATEMAAALRAAVRTEQGPRAGVTALPRTYLDFAARNPAVYDALFQLDGGLAFASEDTPQPLKDAFAALLESLAEVAGDGVHPGVFTEVFWAALHGLATLARAGRLAPQYAAHRLQLLVDWLATL